MSALAHYTSSSEDDDSSDLDHDILSLHQSSASSRTTLRSNSPTAQGAQPPTASGSCEHIAVLLNDPNQAARFLKRHKALVQWGVQARFDAAATAATTERPSKRRKLQVPTCSDCGKTLQRPFVCLECSFSGCWRGEHIVNHLERTGHDFALDVRSGSIFCAACDDLIYHPDLEAVFRSTRTQVERKRARLKNSSHQLRPHFSRRQALINQALEYHSSLVPCAGQKGLLNLGASCYLSVVLQTLLHNPLVKNWFMSDKHPHQLCTRAICLCCEMDKLFTEVYSPDPTPLAPTSFLRAIWRASDEIAGYAQHDAHEVLIAILNSIHTHSSSSRSHNHGLSCTCPIHAAFGAQLQSDVTCGKCGTTRSTMDPILDVSLELEATSATAGAKENTLIGCLKRYTRVEKLGTKEQVMCQKCASLSENATRRLSIHKLPPVLCFQFKRFEHSSAAASKIDLPVRFPSHLDMTPFTSPVIGSASSSSSIPNPSSSSSDILISSESLYSYDLFAVVNHEGQMDTGHYTAFARSQDMWHKFDDDKVTQASLGEVLSSRTRAYMCFYVRTQLEYGNTTPVANGVPRPGTGMSSTTAPTPTPKRPLASLPVQRVVPPAPLGTGPPTRFVPPASAGLPPKPVV